MRCEDIINKVTFYHINDLSEKSDVEKFFEARTSNTWSDDVIEHLYEQCLKDKDCMCLRRARVAIAESMDGEDSILRNDKDIAKFVRDAIVTLSKTGRCKM